MAESTTHLLLGRHGENDYVVEGRLAAALGDDAGPVGAAALARARAGIDG